MNNPIFDHLLIAAIVLLTIILFAIFRKHIRLLIIRIFHGKYSYKHYDSHRRIFFKNPLPQSIKDDFINHVLDFFQPPANIQSFQTNIPIAYLEFPFDSSLKALLRKRGKPSHLSMNKSGPDEIKILGYPEYLFNTDARSYYYFMNDVFFMGEYYFPEISKTLPSEIAGLLSEKYNITGSNGKHDFFIDNPSGYSIQYKNTGFSIMIRYFSRADQNVLQQVSDCISRITEVGLKNKDLEMLNNWKTYL